MVWWSQSLWAFDFYQGKDAENEKNKENRFCRDFTSCRLCCVDILDPNSRCTTDWPTAERSGLCDSKRLVSPPDKCALDALHADGLAWTGADCRLSAFCLCWPCATGAALLFMLFFAGALEIILVCLQKQRGCRFITGFSLLLSIISVLFLIAARICYAAAVLFLLLVLKGILLLCRGR